MGTSYNTNIVTDGLTDCWDVGNRKSWYGHEPATADPFYDLAGDFPAYMINVGGGPDNLSFDPAHMGSITFDGTDDRIQVGNNATSAGSIIVGWSEISVSVWAWIEPTQGCPKLVSTKHANSFDMGVCIDDDHSAADTNWFFCYVGGGYLTTPAGSIIPYLEKWTHYVVTSISGNRRLYIDGELSAADGGGGTIGAADYNMCFGNREDNARPLEGKMASVYLYNRVLSAAEVKQNYEATKSRFLPRITKRGMNLNFDAGDPASYAGGTTTWKDTANGLTTVFNNMDASNFNSSNGGYFAFDGTDEWMTAPNSPLFQSAIADQATFAAWYNVDEAGDDSDPNVPIWAANTNGSAATWSTIHFDSPKQAGLGAKLGGSWSDIGRGTTVLSYDTWYYVVFTWDKANTQVKCYINGALDDTDSTSSASISTSTTGWLSIGATLYNRANTGTPWSFLSGFIGVLQLYDSVLSAGEILDNYNKTKARFGH